VSEARCASREGLPAAFSAVGLAATFDPSGWSDPTGRGIYIALAPAWLRGNTWAQPAPVSALLRMFSLSCDASTATTLSSRPNELSCVRDQESGIRGIHRRNHEIRDTIQIAFDRRRFAARGCDAPRHLTSISPGDNSKVDALPVMDRVVAPT
jgi:hypothetical protein